RAVFPLGATIPRPASPVPCPPLSQLIRRSSPIDGRVAGRFGVSPNGVSPFLGRAAVTVEEQPSGRGRIGPQPADAGGCLVREPPPLACQLQGRRPPSPARRRPHRAGRRN